MSSTLRVYIEALLFLLLHKYIEINGFPRFNLYQIERSRIF